MLRSASLPTLLLSGGCAPDLSALQAVEVERASVVGVRLTTVALIGGATWGTGTLVVEGSQGELLEVPVRLRGGTVGALLDLTREEPELQLELPERSVTADQLLGGYRGSAEEVAFIAGVEVRHLHNPYDVGIDQASLAWGLGFMFAYEWLRIRVDGDRHLVQDTGPFEDEPEDEP